MMPELPAGLTWVVREDALRLSDTNEQAVRVILGGNGDVLKARSASISDCHTTEELSAVVERVAHDIWGDICSRKQRREWIAELWPDGHGAAPC